jgi:hypothetical protein
MPFRQHAPIDRIADPWGVFDVIGKLFRQKSAYFGAESFFAGLRF